MRILFLHGLYAVNKSDKLDWLAAQPGVDLQAPQLHYQLPGWFTGLQAKVRARRPEALVGSSMGGYAAWQLARLLPERPPLLLFNPVLREQDARIRPLSGGWSYSGPALVVLGEQDPVVDPNRTRAFLARRAPQAEVLAYPELQHRIPLEVFQQAVGQWFERLRIL